MSHPPIKSSKQGGSYDRLVTIKTKVALLGGKALLILTRLLNRGGTTLPGRVALTIEPGLIAILAKTMRAVKIIITGTNGKTTTAALLSAMIKHTGAQVIHNQAGSNLKWGIASSLVKEAGLRGQSLARYAVMEADEGAFAALSSELKPHLIALTNIFSDQKDRFSETSFVQKLISAGLKNQPAGGTVVVNADDPLLAGLEQTPSIKRLTYGLASNITCDQPAAQTVANFKQACPLCGKKLTYEIIFYGHLGHYRCPACGFKHPGAMIKLVSCSNGACGLKKLVISHPQGALELLSPLKERYNLYNILAAVACALALNIPQEAIGAGVQKQRPPFGRMEHFTCQDKKIILALVKNPVGANLALEAALKQQEELHLVAAINDKIADGRDISWLEEVNFEQLALNPARGAALTAGGLRATEVALRFKKAGLDQKTIAVLPNLKTALRHALKETPAGGTLLILCNYTAMLELRKKLNQMGLGKPYWKEQ